MSGIDTPNTSVNGLDINLGEEQAEGDVQGEVAKMKEIVSDLQKEVKGKQDRPIQMGGGIPRRDVSLTPTKTTKVDIGNPDTVKQRVSEKRMEKFLARQQGIENNKKN